jgi:adenosylhomocysteine nucleosidase
MRIGIMGAMHQEINSIKNDMKYLKERFIAKREYCSGELNGIDSVLVFSRWGKVAAASTATTLINSYKIDFLIFTGVAGAIDSNLNIGDVVIANSLIQHDMDAFPLYPKFHIPLTDSMYFPVKGEIVDDVKKSADHFLSNIAVEIEKEVLDEFGIKSPKCVIGTIASGDQFIRDVKKTDSLKAEIKNLMCVEMEGAAVAQVCEEHDIPFAIVRVISDKADHSAPVDFMKFVEKIASNYSRSIVKNIYEVHSQS